MKSKKILIVGSGVVGQATGIGLGNEGHDVVFVDINIKIIEELSQQGFEARLPSELDDIQAEIAMFCVATPENSDGSVNLDYITDAVINHGKWLKSVSEERGHTVVIRSTVPPGTTRGVFLPLLEEGSGMKAGRDFGLCMQPEFLRAQSAEEDFSHPWVTVIGELDQQSGDALEKVYANFGDKNKIYRVGLEVAEFVKYVNNLFKATKISFSNEMWRLGQKLDIDANLALEIAVHTTEQYFNPDYGSFGGRPFAGPCFPKDTEGLLAYCQKIGVEMPLLSAVISVNEEMKKLAEQGVIPPAITTGYKWKPSPNLLKGGKVKN